MRQSQLKRDDSLTISIDDAVATEGDDGNQILTYTVTLSEASSDPVTVDFTTVDGTATVADADYEAQTDTITFAPGQTVANISIIANGDETVEPDETLTVELSNPSLGTITDGVGDGTIVNDDLVGITIDDVTIVEGDTGTVDMVFTVTLDEPSFETVMVDFVSSDNTATSGEDYNPVSGALTFAPGETTQTITVTTTPETVLEADETYTITLSNPVDAEILDGQGLGTIVNDDMNPMISISDATVVEGDTGLTDLVFTVSIDQPSTQDVTVTVNTADGTATAGDDYQPLVGTLVTIPAGETEVTVTVPVVTETVVEADETLTLEASNPVNGEILDGTGEGTIVNDDGNTLVPVPDSSSTPVNTPVAIPVLQNDYDPEDESFEIIDATDPANGSVFFTPDGTVIYTPDTDFVGVDTFEYTIRDEFGNEETTTVTVTVGTNTVTAAADSAVTPLDTPVVIEVLTNDFDINGDTFEVTGIVSNPANGTVAINPDGTITYTPNPGYTGDDVFVYEITDSEGNTDTAEVTVVIDSNTPQATDDYRETPMNTPVIVDVLTNDTDPDGDTLTVVPGSVTQPANGTVELNPDGTITYTPNDGFFGYDTFTYTIVDEMGNTDIATVTIFVPQNASLAGTAWLDADFDDVIDPEELLIEGWFVW